VPTAWAYRQLARFPDALKGRAGRARRLIERLETATLAEAAAEFYNSLEAPVLTKYPLLALFQEFLRNHGAAACLMSGSGSTTFAIATDQQQGEALREKFQSHFGTTHWTALVGLG
jgi:4-diphosphocytidyl-2-C-methyl-D-erythritol kinase